MRATAGLTDCDEDDDNDNVTHEQGAMVWEGRKKRYVAIRLVSDRVGAHVRFYGPVSGNDYEPSDIDSAFSFAFAKLSSGHPLVDSNWKLRLGNIPARKDSTATTS